MCGIVFARRFDGKPANNVVKTRYNKQKKRGTDGYGMAKVNGHEFLGVDRSTDEKGIMGALEETEATEILFHHRYPTSTPNIVESTHPIEVKHEDLEYDYYVVHNGVISNCKHLKKQHEEMGFEYTTEIEEIVKTRNGKKSSTDFNDTEAVAIDFALAIESGRKKLDAYGSMALVALAVDKESGEVKKLHYGRNARNPLKLEVQDGQFMTLRSLGTGETVKAHTLFTVDNETGEFTNRKLTFGSYGYKGQSNRAGYKQGGYYNSKGRADGGWKQNFDNSKKTEVEHEEEVKSLEEVIENLDGWEPDMDLEKGIDENIEERYNVEVREPSFLEGFEKACEEAIESEYDIQDHQWLEDTANILYLELEALYNLLDEFEAGEIDYIEEDEEVLSERIGWYWDALNKYSELTGN